MWLLLAYTGGDANANRVQLEAIRTAGTIVVGTGGAAALLLAARRQRSTEIALKQKDRDQAYALERLAQDHIEQRQTVVNVLCAYLRMPFTVPGSPPDDTTLSMYRERVQEREVRLAAQRLLATHLHPGTEPTHPVTTFWAGIDLDLTNATLINLSLNGCHPRIATFTRAHFAGDASFGEARFTGDAVFGEAQFDNGARFSEARFTGKVPSEVAPFWLPPPPAGPGSQEEDDPAG